MHAALIIHVLGIGAIRGGRAIEKGLGELLKLTFGTTEGRENREIAPRLHEQGSRK
jgi:hypothetical protein